MAAMRALVTRRKQTELQDDGSSVPSGFALVLVSFGSIVALIVAMSLHVITGYTPGIFGLSLNPARPADTGQHRSIEAATPSDSSDRPNPGAAPTGSSPAQSASGAAPSHAPSADPIQVIGADTRRSRNTAPIPAMSSALPGHQDSAAATTSAAAAPSSTTGGPSTTAAPTPTAVAPAPDDSAVNSPSAPVLVDAVAFGTTAATSRTVTLTGLRPRDSSIAPSATFIDWGDGSGRALSQNSASTGSAVTSGLSYSHSYTQDGSYTITWGYSTGSDRSWSHRVTLGGTGSSPGPLTLTGSVDAGGAQQFTATGPDVAWQRWVLDYGDGTATIGAGRSGFADVMPHSYDAAGYRATLTVFGEDGEVATASFVTP